VAFSLPEEFFDRTSTQLLAAPVPQFLYAQMFLSAMGLSLSVGSLASPGRAPITGVGADYRDFNQDKLNLASALPGEILAVKADFNAAPGATLRINRPKYESTTYTAAARTIALGASISTTPIQIGETQNNITLYRFGGPYDQANSRVAPFPIEAFTANLGVHKVAQMVGNQLSYDFHKFIDAVHVLLLDQAAVTVYPDTMTADNDATVAGMYPFTYEQLNRAEQLADQANLPTFSDGYRCFVGTTLQLKQLKDDRQYQRASEFHKEYSILFPSYVGSVGKTHIFKSTTLTITNNGSSVPIHYGHYIAPGTLMGAMGRPPSVRTSTNDNFGETLYAIWIADLAFKMANNSFVLSVRSSA